MSSPRYLRLRTVRDAVLVPRPVLNDKSAGAGVLQRRDGALHHVDDTGVRRRGRQYVLPPSTDAVPARRIDDAVYAGFLFGHFGHFLLESLGRLWLELLDDRTPVVWIAGTCDRFTPWMVELLDLLGVGGERVIVDATSGPLEIDELLVPDRGFEVQRYLHPWFASRLARWDAHPDPRASVWLSRTALGPLAGVDDESRIEARLARKGWTIVHPEHLSVAEQIDVLAGARHLAGIEGSAFHSLLMVNGFGGTIDVLTRHDSSNFEVIAEQMGWDQVRHALPGGQSREWNRPSGARDVHWSGVDVRAAVRTVLESSRRRDAAPRRRLLRGYEPQRLWPKR